MVKYKFYKEVIYIPEVNYTWSVHTQSPASGLYDFELRPIKLAQTIRLNTFVTGGKQISNRIVVGNDVLRGIDIASLPRVDGPFFFGGKAFNHYGHFLLETLSRFWPVFTNSDFSKRFLFVNDAKSVISQSVANTECFSKIPNIGFFNFAEPCIISNVYVAAPGFTICGGYLPEYRDFMLELGKRLVPDIDKISNTNLTPLYMSKTDMSIQSTGIVNEQEIESEMISRGVEIYFPHNFSLSEQIRKLATHKFIMGQASTAIDTLLFCPGNKKIATIMTNDASAENFTQIDELCNNQSVHCMFEHCRVELPVDNKFLLFKTRYDNIPDIVDSLTQH